MKKLKTTALLFVGMLYLGLTPAYSNPKKEKKTIAILLYEGYNMLDVVGAYQTFPGLFLSGYEIKFVAKRTGLIKSSHDQSLYADADFRETQKADILFIPGGTNIDEVIEDKTTINWIKRVNKFSKYTLTVGSGSVLLASTKALKKKKTATQWFNKRALEKYGATYVDDSYIAVGKYYSGKGASASIDMVLELISIIANEDKAKAIQLFLEYDPHSPVMTGKYQDASLKIKSLVKNLSLNFDYRLFHDDPETIAILLYDGFTMLDVVGAYQVFKELEPLGYAIKFVATEKGLIRSDMYLTLEAEYTMKEVDDAAILYCPGGTTTYTAMKDQETVDWIKKINATSTYTTGADTGTLLLCKAGLLTNKKASSHWYISKFLKNYKTTYTQQRYTVDGKFITGSGVSSSIDLALLIVELIASEDYAKAVQFKMGYHPSPIFDAGTPKKSTQETIDMLSDIYKGADRLYRKAEKK